MNEYLNTLLGEEHRSTLLAEARDNRLARECRRRPPDLVAPRVPADRGVGERAPPSCVSAGCAPPTDART